MLRAVAVLLAVLLAGLAVFLGAEEGPFKLDIRPVPLNPVDPRQDAVGALRYRGGLWLKASDPRFGGLSDLRIGPDGARVLMVSDCGYAFRAALVHDDRGFLTGIRDPELEELRALGGRRLRPGEEDAECLAPDGDDGFLVGFERLHRLWRYPAGDHPLRGAPVSVGMPAGLSHAPVNMGIEAMTRLADGRLLLIEEGQPGAPASATTWVGMGREWTEWRCPLYCDPAVPAQPFRPTSAATLPDGDVLVLERRYPPVAARIRRLDKASLLDGHDLSGKEVARLDLPLTLDNFEGIEVHAGSRGEVLVYLLSDDNNCRKLGSRLRPSSQRTLLLLFALAS